MVHLFKSAAARALSLALLVLLAGAALLGAVRMAAPFADQLRAPVEALLTEHLGLDVEVGALGLRLVGWVPRLRLSDARLFDPGSGRTQLSLKELRLDLDPGASLRAWAPKVASVTLVGAHLVVRRDADGRIRLAGLEGLTSGAGGVITFFLGNGRFFLTESDLYLVDDRQAAPVLHLSGVAMRFDNAGLRHRIGAEGRLFGDPATRVRFAADLYGPAEDLSLWQGPLYLHWQGKDLGPVLDGRLPPGLHLGSGLADIEAWGGLKGGVLADALARFELRGLVAWREDPAGSAAPVHLQRLTGLIQWDRLGDGWRVDAAELQVTRQGATTPATDASLHISRDAAGDWSATGTLGRLDLGLTRDLLTLLPRRPPAIAGLQAARLNGVAYGLEARLDGHDKEAEGDSWSLSGRVDGVGFDSVGKIPGIRGLAGRFVARPDGGRFALDASDLSLALPELLRGPIAIDRASGEVRWERGANGALRIQAPELQVSNADVHTRSRLKLRLPGDAGGEPFVDLQTELSDVEAEVVSRYLPVGLLRPNLVDWLDRALVAGTVPVGTLTFRGSPADFPFREGEGRFRVAFSVVDGVLDYRRGWPRIEAIAAEVRFDGPSLAIEARSARFLDSELQGVSARIPDLTAAETRAIAISGRAQGPFADGLRVLRGTPLATRFGRLAAGFEASGCSLLDLGLVIPLHRGGSDARVELDGLLTWPEAAALGLPQWGISVGELAGELRFTQQGLSAEGIKARLWDEPIEIRINSEEVDGQPGARTRVQVAGRHDVATLARQLPSPLWGLARGRSDWSLAIDVHAGDLGGERLPLDLALRTELRGIAVDLPAPLGKTAAAARPLRVNTRLDAADGLDLRGSYGDLGFALGLQHPAEGGLGLAGVSLNLGGAARGGVPSDGLEITGRLDQLDLNAWLNWRDRSTLANGSAESRMPPLRSVDLRVGRLALSDFDVRDLGLRLGREPGGWRAQLEGRELTGTARVPERVRQEPIEVRLTRLDLKGVLGEPGAGGAARERKGSNPDPRRSPTLDLRIERLLWGEELIGSLALSSDPRPDGITLTGLSLDGPLLTVRGRGAWVAEGAGPRSELKVTTEAADMGAFLRLIEFKSQLDEAPASATFELGWPGGPADFSLANLQGRATAEVGEGSLLDVEPGVGRVLGILNLAALQRRLSLDFRDLFDRGYAFEQISGAMVAEGGKARIERLTIEGPSASISVEGETDLLAHRFDQVVTVTPRLGSSLAVASAVAAGPLVGAAVYLADKVSGGVVDRIGRYQYEISGPWEDPEIRRLGASPGVTPDATSSSPPAGAPDGTSGRSSGPPAERRAPPTDLGPFFDSR